MDNTIILSGSDKPKLADAKAWMRFLQIPHTIYNWAKKHSIVPKIKPPHVPCATRGILLPALRNIINFAKIGCANANAY